MERHPQVPVKVTAFVDAGVAPLVEALGALRGVVTLDSCQGTDVGDGLQASVYFVLGGQAAGDWQEPAGLVGWVAARCREAGLQATVRLEWVGSNDLPRGHLVVPPEEVALAAAVLREAHANGT